MALVQINIREHRIDGRDTALQAIARLPKGKPVIVMTHGYRFSPQHPQRCPHRHILSMDRSTCWKAVSWPRHLHLHRDGAGLGIALGWEALGSLGTAATRAFDVGATLARLINDINALRPDLPVHLLAHSLGARVALSALSDARAGAVRHVILMSGAEYRSVALCAMASPAGRRARVVNMCSRENALFDGLFRLHVPPPVWTDRALSACVPHVPGWTDVRIDAAHHRARLREDGIRLRAPSTPICHWSTYLRPGLFKLYRALFDPAHPDFAARLEASLTLQKMPRVTPLLPATADRRTVAA
jgi:pimeloyl-ACP methyl ester carboxylesterase